MRAAGRWLPLLLAAACAGRDGGVDPHDLTMRSPDQAPIEVCPPKAPPPGTIPPAEMARRDEELMEGRQREYQRQLGERAELEAQGQKEAERTCDAVIAPMLGQPSGPDTPRVAVMRDRMGRHEDQLVTCVALAANDPALCVAARRSAVACRLRLALLRRRDGRGSRAQSPAAVAELAFEMCRRDAPKASCAGLRDAVRRGKPTACPTSPELAALCAILAWRDPARCPPPGPDQPPKAGEACAEQAKWVASLAEGKVAGLWPGDASADAALADAVAGKPDACSGLRDEIRRKCISAAMPPLPEAPVRPQDVPGAAPAAAPSRQGATPNPGRGLGGAPTAPGAPEPKPAPR